MSREAVNLQRSGQNGWFTAVHTPSSFPIPVTRGQHAAAPREIEWRALVRPGRRHGPQIPYIPYLARSVGARGVLQFAWMDRPDRLLHRQLSFQISSAQCPKV